MSESRLRVTVVDPASSFRRGLGAALAAAGCEVSESTDHADIALITLRSEDDAAVIESFSAERPVLALIPELDAQGFAHALSHGAAAAADWHDEPESIARSAIELLRGQALVPIGLLRELADLEAVHGPDLQLTHEELDWLVRLAEGATVVQIAFTAGYSERAMFRRLHDLYRRLGVSGRAEALVAAQRLGLLDRDR